MPHGSKQRIGGKRLEAFREPAVLRTVTVRQRGKAEASVTLWTQLRANELVSKGTDLKGRDSWLCHFTAGTRCCSRNTG